MKQYILALIVATSTLAAAAQTKVERTDTTTTITNPGNVIISETANGISVKVAGQNDSTLVYTYRNTFSDDATIVTEQNDGNDFGISVPFMRNRNNVMGKNEVHRSHWDMYTDGIGLGFNSMTSTPEGMGGHRAAGFEAFYSDILGVCYKPWNSGPAFSLGFGISANLYSLRNGLRFARGEDGTSVVYQPFVEGAYSRSSGMHTFNLLVPFNLRYTIKRNFVVILGAWGNITTHACEWAQYKLDGVKYNESWNGVKKRTFRMSYVARITCNAIGAYIKYTPKNAIKEGFGPQFKEISAGIIFPF
jgi:hypothetical protein